MRKFLLLLWILSLVTPLYAFNKKNKASFTCTTDKEEGGTRCLYSFSDYRWNKIIGKDNQLNFAYMVYPRELGYPPYLEVSLSIPWSLVRMTPGKDFPLKMSKEVKEILIDTLGEGVRDNSFIAWSEKSFPFHVVNLDETKIDIIVSIENNDFKLLKWFLSFEKSVVNIKVFDLEITLKGEKIENLEQLLNPQPSSS